MNYDMLCRFKRLAEMLGMEADKLDDLIRLEKLRKKEHLTTMQVDELRDLLAIYRDVVGAC